MSSTQEGSCTNHGRGFKGMKVEKATRRTWSPNEEAALLSNLKDLVANGWKSDNGFRGGYLTRLEDAMSKEFPGANIKASPHITSKIASWKRSYYSLSLILSRSGVGFNAKGNHMIDCPDDQWAQITKVDNNAKPMRCKPWPMFEDWEIVFGRDRATGDHAEDMIDAVNNLMQEEDRAQHGMQGDDYEVCMDDVSVNDVGEQSSAHSEKPNDVQKKPEKGKKRKTTVEGLQGVVEIFGEICRGTNARLELVANRIGYDFDVDKAKKEAYVSLQKIPGLDRENKFELCDIFTDQLNRLITFSGLPDEDKEAYVLRLLKNKK